MHYKALVIGIRAAVVTLCLGPLMAYSGERGSSDHDGDGIQNGVDHCPGEAGTAEFSGCKSLRSKNLEGRWKGTVTFTLTPISLTGEAEVPEAVSIPYTTVVNTTATATEFTLWGYYEGSVQGESKQPMGPVHWKAAKDSGAQVISSDCRKLSNAMEVKIDFSSATATLSKATDTLDVVADGIVVPCDRDRHSFNMTYRFTGERVR